MPTPVSPAPSDPAPAPASAATEQITLGGGCFWCLEAVFLEVDGVLAVESGYSNGALRQPSYEAVCSGATGHAEVVRLSWDPARIGLEALLRIFFAIHDPTTPNRQGHDVGSQYRSGIYWHDAAQAKVARGLMAEAARAWGAPVVTELAPADNYWPAEAYHQRYFEQHPGQGYCVHVVAPKLARFRAAFAEHRRR
jgi:peptide-methionine (S)-S-oxide reductase